MDTVPRKWNTGTEVRDLWEPEGYEDTESGKFLPSGDLVEWFVRWPHHQKKDVPDTMALVDAVDRKTHARLCYHVRPSRKRSPESDKRKPLDQGRSTSRAGYASRFYDRCYRR